MRRRRWPYFFERRRVGRRQIKILKTAFLFLKYWYQASAKAVKGLMRVLRLDYSAYLWAVRKHVPVRVYPLAYWTWLFNPVVKKAGKALMLWSRISLFVRRYRRRVPAPREQYQTYDYVYRQKRGMARLPLWYWGQWTWVKTAKKSQRVPPMHYRPYDPWINIKRIAPDFDINMCSINDPDGAIIYICLNRDLDPSSCSLNTADYIVWAWLWPGQCGRLWYFIRAPYKIVVRPDSSGEVYWAFEFITGDGDVIKKCEAANWDNPCVLTYEEFEMAVLKKYK
jgi:hypothetical protein